jgi:hypothetical protein
MISASVGASARNVLADVNHVQILLNRFNATLGFKPVLADGNCGAKTLTAIRNFQTIKLGIANPNGLMAPGGATITALEQFDDRPAPPVVSGAAWWHANQYKYLNSVRIEDLAPDFRAKVQFFISALREAGASVAIGSTRRSQIRAYLMHVCWRIAANELPASGAPTETGCTIKWDHGDGAKSRAAAKEMRDLFGIVFEPSLKSRHIDGLAIDMNISWQGTIRVRDAGGNMVFLSSPANGANPALHKIGASYGVFKLVSDLPHWSNDGV